MQQCCLNSLEVGRFSLSVVSTDSPLLPELPREGKGDGDVPGN